MRTPANRAPPPLCDDDISSAACAVQKDKFGAPDAYTTTPTAPAPFRLFPSPVFGGRIDGEGGGYKFFKDGRDTM